MVTVARKSVPERFKQRDRWLMWDNSSDTPRRPHWKGDFGISWSDPDDWHTFEEAYQAMQERESWGIGYVFQPGDDEYLIDIDGPFTEDGDPRDWFPGLDRFADAGAYMEWSPSGNGVHIPVEGQPPESWSDCEVDPDLHQGVDVLTNKFCTFTGDTLAESGDSVTDVNAAPFLFKCYRNIRGEPWFDSTDATKQEYGSDEWLDDETVEAALDAINPDLPHTEWVKVGYAVHDYDSGSRGKSLFKSWSQQGEKWDREAERSIESIWSGATAGNGVTVGTLIYKAKENGWNPPSPSTPEPPEPKGESDDTDAETTEWWSYVRETYSTQTNKEGRSAATDALENETNWMYVVDSETLWVYDDSKGYFNRWGEQTAHRVLERELGTHYSQTEAKEIIGRLQARNQTRRKELNARTRDSPLLCVGNGVVDLRTGKKHDHSPEYKFTRGLAWDYDPARADPEPAKEFLDDVTKREADRDTILDHLAHGLMPGHPYRAFLIMYGPGSNGKTRVGKLLRGFVGEENAASVELQDLTGDDSFATGGLPGAFVNVGDDISVSEIRDTSIIKSLTGDGTVRANEKYEKQYEFENEAAMFFSANEPPRIRERTQAISDRLYPIEMPYRFVDDPDPDSDLEKEKIPGIAENLLGDDAAMRGLLLLAVKHAQQVIERNGQYSMPEGPQERRELYESASDPIKRFALTHMEEASGSDVVLKDDAFAVYQQMCDKENARPAGTDTFKEQVGGIASIDLESTRTRKLTPGDSRDSAWKYVTFADSAKELMPARLVDRYFGESDTKETDTDESGGSENVAYNATKLTNAAESLTGYVTVTAEVVKVESFGETTKAILKDESGAMDLVTWDETLASHITGLEGETVVIEDAEVGEHDGTRQLQPVDGLTEINTIQAGVGHTKRRTPDDGQAGLAETATDGGDGLTDKSQVRQYLANCETNETVTAAQIAGEVDVSPDTAEATLEKASEEGQVQRDGDDWLVR